MRFAINAKDFKKMVDKALTGTEKKGYISYLQCIKMQVLDNVLYLSGTDLTVFLTCKYDLGNGCVNGLTLVDRDDLKMLSKLSGLLEIETEEDTLRISVNQKIIRIPALSADEYPEFPIIDEIEEIGTAPQDDFLDAVENLSSFLSKADNNMWLICYNVDFQKRKIYALDGYRVGWKSISMNTNSDIADYGLLGISLGIFKKVLNAKSSDEITFSITDKYIKISGGDFTYIQKRIDGKYFDIDLLTMQPYEKYFCVDTKQLLDIVKYDCSVIDKKKSLPILMYVKDKLTVYYASQRCEVLDKIEIDHELDGDVLMGFNPLYWLDVLNVTDSDTIQVYISNPKAPVKIEANKYGFLLSPVNLTKNDQIIEKFQKFIKKDIM